MDKAQRLAIILLVFCGCFIGLLGKIEGVALMCLGIWLMQLMHET